MGGSVIPSLLPVDVQALGARAKHNVWRGSGILKSAICQYLFLTALLPNKEAL